MWQIISNYPIEQLLGFVAGGLVVNFTPGQDIFFATACGIQGGPRVGAVAGLGVGVGVLWHVALAALGLSALIAANPQMLQTITYIGAGYLLYLAWKSWNSAGGMQAGSGVHTYGRAFRRGILSNILNPKPVLFILAFLPQFVDSALGPVWMQIVLLGLVFSFTGTIVTAGFGYLAGHAGRVIGARMGVVNKVAAVLFAGLAARLIWVD